MRLSSRAKKGIAAAVILLLAVAGGVYYYLNLLPPVMFTYIEWSPDIIRAGQPVTFKLTLNNSGGPAAYRVDVYVARVHYAHVGAPLKVGSFTVQAPGHGSATASYTYTFEKPGFYVLYFRANGAELRQLIYASPGYRPDANFSFAVFGDNRPVNGISPQPGTFKELIREVSLIHPDFSVLVGDVIYGYRSDVARLKWQWSDFMSVYSSSKVPIFVAPGNHEMQTEEVPDSGNPIAQALYISHLGRLYYAFEYGNSLFIVLDTDIVGQSYLVTGRQLQWLRHMLKVGRRYKHVFVFMHKPVVTYEGGDMLDNADQLVKLFTQYHVTAVFQGHDHAYYYERVNGVDYYVTGGAGAPLYLRPESGGVSHYLVVHVDGDKVHVQFFLVPSFKVDGGGRRVTVNYIFDQPLVFHRYDYTWSVRPEPVLLRGIPLEPGQVSGGKPVVVDNGVEYVEAFIKPGGSVTVSSKP